MQLSVFTDLIKKVFTAYTQAGDDTFQNNCEVCTEGVANFAQTAQLSCQELLCVGNLVADVLKDDNAAYTFLNRSFSQRAVEMATYSREHFPQACDHWSCFMTMEEAFRFMLEFRYFSFHPNRKCEHRRILTQEELGRVTSELYYFTDAASYDNYDVYRENVGGNFRLCEDESASQNLIEEILLFIVFFSPDNDLIALSGKDLLSIRLGNRGLDSGNLTALVLPDDRALFLALGNACWQLPYPNAKQNGFRYLWAGVKGTGLPLEGDEGVALLKDLFYKAEELHLKNGEIWEALAEDMRSINESSGKRCFEAKMIFDCEGMAVYWG